MISKVFTSYHISVVTNNFDVCSCVRSLHVCVGMCVHVHFVLSSIWHLDITNNRPSGSKM